MNSVFRYFSFNSEKIKKDQKNENIRMVLVFVFFDIFVYFRDLKKFFGISVNSATLALEKCHYHMAKQAILRFKTGTVPMLKWLRSDSTKSLFQKSSNLLTQQG